MQNFIVYFTNNIGGIYGFVQYMLVFVTSGLSRDLSYLHVDLRVVEY